ncbi:MAG TPA: OadG family protein [Candidatus Copromonas faecavium]|uniref:OadG family protein n=1 Tax=Candidatus Copromonas faecavium (nom. illeg.) TaxID=2840740 RepID=A0A9D1D597_9FIRM|nr:OadG family protein [Candidatus Copromonas faecavium]
MKQNIKRIWLALCMSVLLLALSGCAASSDTQEELDPSAVITMQQGAQQYLALFSSLTDEQLEQYIAQSEANNDYVMENAFKSWDNVKDDLGAYVSSGIVTVEETDGGYIARIQAAFEKRNMEFSLIVSDDLSEVEGISFSPEYTVAEKMSKAAMNTLIGMGVVFLVLIFISWLISLFKYINRFEAKFKESEAKKTAQAEKNAAPASAPAPVQTAASAPAPVQQAVPAPAAVSAQPAAYEVQDVSDDMELISVIAAAIAAAEGKTAANGLVVRSVKRVSRRNWR